MEIIALYIMMVVVLVAIFYFIVLPLLQINPEIYYFLTIELVNKIVEVLQSAMM